MLQGTLHSNRILTPWWNRSASCTHPQHLRCDADILGRLLLVRSRQRMSVLRVGSTAAHLHTVDISKGRKLHCNTQPETRHILELIQSLRSVTQNSDRNNGYIRKKRITTLAYVALLLVNRAKIRPWVSSVKWHGRLGSVCQSNRAFLRLPTSL